jgi:replication factor C subunit 2/4
MEKEGRSTRFCLVCNYISRIIEPITSRCAKFRFKPLSSDAICKRLEMICEKENISLKDDESMNSLIATSEGDMRKAITTLQSCSRQNTVVSKREIFEVISVHDHFSPRASSTGSNDYFVVLLGIIHPLVILV